MKIEIVTGDSQDRGSIKIVKNAYHLVTFNMREHQDYDLDSVMVFLREILLKSMEEEFSS